MNSPLLVMRINSSSSPDWKMISPPPCPSPHWNVNVGNADPPSFSVRYCSYCSFSVINTSPAFPWAAPIQTAAPTGLSTDRPERRCGSCACTPRIAHSHIPPPPSDTRRLDRCSQAAQAAARIPCMGSPGRALRPLCSGSGGNARYDPPHQ